jgi:predicted amidohydrolase YtcJ
MALQLAHLFIERPELLLPFPNTTTTSTNDNSLTIVPYEISGGEIDYNIIDHYPTGILRERAVEPLIAAFNQYRDTTSLTRFIEEGLDKCRRVGLTTVHTNDEDSYAIYHHLQTQQKLPLRVLLTPQQQEINKLSALDIHPFSLFQYQSQKEEESEDKNATQKTPAKSSTSTDETTTTISNQIINAHTMESRLGIHRVKIFTDGSLGAGTAAVKLVSIESTVDMNTSTASPPSTTTVDTDHKGILIHSLPTLISMIEDAGKAGYRVEIHAIGDAAADQVIQALLTIQERYAHHQSFAALNRPILTHCQLLGAEIVQNMNRLNMIANIQPSFVPTDMRWVMERIHHSSQLQYAYAWKTLLTHDVAIAGGSDAPIEDCNPFTGIYDAICRWNRQRLPLSNQDEATVITFRPEEKLSFSEAMQLYTEGGAYAGGYESVLGKVAVGYVADLVFIDGQVVMEPERLYNLQPDLVIVGGNIVFSSNENGFEYSRPRIIKESSQSQEIRLKNFNSVMLNEKSKEVPLNVDAPYIPGKGGYYSAHDDSIYNRRGYCNCLIHMKYCL